MGGMQSGLSMGGSVQGWRERKAQEDGAEFQGNAVYERFRQQRELRKPEHTGKSPTGGAVQAQAPDAGGVGGKAAAPLAAAPAPATTGLPQGQPQIAAVGRPELVNPASGGMAVPQSASRVSLDRFSSIIGRRA